MAYGDGITAYRSSHRIEGISGGAHQHGNAVQGQRDDDVDRIKDLRSEDERQKDEQWQRREGVED